MENVFKKSKIWGRIIIISIKTKSFSCQPCGQIFRKKCKFILFAKISLKLVPKFLFDNQKKIWCVYIKTRNKNFLSLKKKFENKLVSLFWNYLVCLQTILFTLQESHLLWFLAIFGNLWQSLVIFFDLHQLLVIFCNLQQSLAIFGNIQRLWVIFNNLWRSLTILGNLRGSLVIFSDL